MPTASEPVDGGGTVYLIHLDPPYKHARHYTGWTSNLGERLEAHRAGRGARLLEVVKEAGGSWRLARTWPGPKALERAIKDLHAAPEFCPECSPHPRQLSKGRAAAVSAGRETPPQPGLRARPGPVAAPQPQAVPSPVKVPVAERGAAHARLRIGQLIAAGRSVEEITAVEQRVFRDFDIAAADANAREWHLGYQAEADRILRAHQAALSAEPEPAAELEP